MENMRVFQCFFSAGLCHLCHSMHFLSLFVLIRDFVWWSRKKSEQPHAYLMMYKLNDSSTEQRSYIWFMKPTQMSHHFTLRPVQLGPIFFYLLSLKFNIMHFKANAHFFRSSVPKLYVQFMFAMLFFMSSHIHFIICLCIDLLFTLALIIMCCWPKTVFGVFVKKKLKKRLTCSFCSRKFGSSIDGGPFPTVHYYWTNKRRAFLLSSQTFFSSPPLSTSE